MHGIIPPFLLEAIAANGTPSQQTAARRTLEIDSQIRAEREAVATARSEPVAPAERPHKNRRVYSSGNTFGLPGTLIRSEGQGPSGDVAVDEAYDGLGGTFDLYWDIYGRDSLDDKGLDLLASVHYGAKYNNAFWNGTQIVFGDGDGEIYKRFTLDVDVIGHELTHGVIDGKLPYHGQGGALNESLADVFGSLVKQRTLGQTAEEADWLIGAGMFVPEIKDVGVRSMRAAGTALHDQPGVNDVALRSMRAAGTALHDQPGINGVALRSMRAPGTAFHDPVLIHPPLMPDGKDPQPDHMSGYVPLPNDKDHDGGGVHINSGIPNRAFYLAATAIRGFAWEKAGRIWYHTLSKLPYNADFQQFATLTARIAEELYPTEPEIRHMVVRAWHEVGLGGDPLHLNRSGAFNAPQAVGAPSGVVFASLGVTNIVYRDAQGRLHELWQKGSAAGTSNLTQLANNAIHAANDPTSYINTVEELEVALYRATDGHVHSLYWSLGAVGHDALSGAASAPPTAGKPAGYIQKDGTSVVIYRAGDGNLHSLWWIGGGTPAHENLSGVHPKAAGDPVPYINTITGENIVAYRGTDGQIHTLYWTTGAVGHDNLSSVAGSPKAAGDPVAYYTSHNDTHQVIYRGEGNHIYELSWTGVNVVAYRDLTAEAGAPEAASDPAAYYIPANNTKHVIYRCADNHLRELWWIVGSTNPVAVDVTKSAYAPTAVDKPAAFVFENAGTQHVVFRGTDNHIHEIRWT
jgi:Zn-dependent metalloprotease